MKYTLNQLQIFLKISQTHSITKAAEELHLTQPAVSIQLNNFQEQFEIPLTEVIGRKLYITDFGFEIANACERILDEVGAIKYKSLSWKGQLVGRLKLSVVSTGKYVMPYFLSDFFNRHQGIDLNMDVTNKQQVIESLENNEVDFSLVSLLPENMNIDRVPLMKNELYFVGNTEKIFDKNIYNENLLEELPLIYREKGSATRYEMEKFISENNISIKKKIELTSNEAVKQAVLAGLGYSIMPLIGIKNELTSNKLQIIPVKNLPIITTWNLIWLKGKNFSPVANGFLDYIKKEKNNIINNQFEWYKFNEKIS